MTEDRVVNLIEQIHGDPTRVCIVVSGAGTTALAALFSVAGASRTVIEAQVPYSSAALDNYLGTRSDQYVSGNQARLMAMKAYERASALLEVGSASGRLVGLSCTAAIATDRERRGENRLHVAWHDGQLGATYSVILKKGARERAGEEAVCSAVILNALAEACGIDERVPVDLLGSEIVERRPH